MLAALFEAFGSGYDKPSLGDDDLFRTITNALLLGVCWPVVVALVAFVLVTYVASRPLVWAVKFGQRTAKRDGVQ
jgi:predicted ABC-type sugar transport system permease subunit